MMNDSCILKSWTFQRGGEDVSVVGDEGPLELRNGLTVDLKAARLNGAIPISHPHPAGAIQHRCHSLVPQSPQHWPVHPGSHRIKPNNPPTLSPRIKPRHAPACRLPRDGKARHASRLPGSNRGNDPTGPEIPQF